MITLRVGAGGDVPKGPLFQQEDLGGHAAVCLGAVQHHAGKAPVQRAKVDGGVVGEGVVRGGGGELLQGAFLPGEEMGQGGQVLGALFLGGQVLVHREHLDHAVAVKVCGCHFAVGAQQVFGDVFPVKEIGVHRGGAARGARGAPPADEHILPAVAVQVPKQDHVHLGGGVGERGGNAPGTFPLFQKADLHAAPLWGDKANGVLHAVAGPVPHDDGRAVLPPLGVDKGQLLPVPLQQLINALLFQVGPGRGHKVLGVENREGAPRLGQAEKSRQGRGGQAFPYSQSHRSASFRDVGFRYT